MYSARLVSEEADTGGCSPSPTSTSWYWLWLQQWLLHFLRLLLWIFIRVRLEPCLISVSLFLKCFAYTSNLYKSWLWRPFFPMNLQLLLFMVAMTNVQYNHMMVCTVHHLTTSIPRLLAEPMIVLHTFSKGIPAKAGSCDFILAIS